jgi:hypothetical protein
MALCILHFYGRADSYGFDGGLVDPGVKWEIKDGFLAIAGHGQLTA